LLGYQPSIYYFKFFTSHLDNFDI